MNGLILWCGCEREQTGNKAAQPEWFAYGPYAHPTEACDFLIEVSM
jgi:hypothetical protein